jgi:hypothetical protein
MPITLRRAAVAGFCLVIAAGCAGRRESAPIENVGESTGQAARTAAETTREGFGGAATAPLEDLNIRREEVPAPLKRVGYVYEAAPLPSCERIWFEIQDLNTVLGVDYDEEEEKRGRGERAGEAAGDFLIDTIRGVTTDVIPLRGVVREATGAAAHQRRVARAYTKGHARRAYLKGLGAAQGCAAPAAPSVLHAPEEEPAIEIRDINETDSARWGEGVTRTRDGDGDEDAD